ncbi:MAG: multiheme c-type cytochrome [Bryobacteraceae bacterium]
MIVFFCIAGAANSQAEKYSCATCHAREAASQPATPMARALLLPGQNPTLKAHTKLSFAKGKFNYFIETQGDASTYIVTDGERTISLPIQWTFGAGAQTFVLSWNGELWESMVSYYPEIPGLDITIGDNNLVPKTLEEAVGRKLAAEEVISCFGCHSTHSSADHKLTLASLSPGVRCEHCHTKAPAHLAAISRLSGPMELKSTMPEQLGKRSSESISNFCGQCHRSWETVVRNNWRGEVNVRFQPYRLANSKCFDGMDARISCLACHNPHQNLVKDDTNYDAKCLACHASGTAHTASVRIVDVNNAPPPTAKACTVSSKNCVSCHMPKVPLPGGHQTFTDHNIRIVKPGERYPN